MDTTPHSTDPEASQILSSQVPAIDEIPFRLVAAHERKTTKLLKNAIDHESLKSRNSYFSFAFETPIFLHSVRIDVEEFVEGAKFEYVWEGIDGRRHYGDALTTSDEVSISVR